MRSVLVVRTRAYLRRGALSHPELVDRLVLVCTATGGPGVVRTPEETTAAWEANAGRTPQEFARATMPLSLRPGWTDEHPVEFEALLADRLEYPTPPDCWRAQYDACLDWAARVTPVDRIGAPTLVLHGDTDRIVPYANGVELARRIPGSRFETFPGGGHLLFIEDAPKFNAMVASFLTG